MNRSPYSDPGMADVYDRIAARLQFTAPGHDLVEVAGVSRGDVVLDVGTGTGVVAAAARRAAGPAGIIVGVDAALEMVRHAPKEAGSFVLSQVPVLPFRNESFDAVVAGFVVSHFENYREGLADMVRVCRAGGRIGISGWGDAPNPAAALWNNIAGRYVPREQLNEAFHKHIPWDTWFSRRENIAHALEDAGLISVVTETRYYSVRMPADDYLLSREASVQGLVLRAALSLSDWDDFRTNVSQQLRNQFGAVVEYDRDVHFGVGTRARAIFSAAQL